MAPFVNSNRIIFRPAGDLRPGDIILATQQNMLEIYGLYSHPHNPHYPGMIMRVEMKEWKTGQKLLGLHIVVKILLDNGKLCDILVSERATFETFAREHHDLVPGGS